MNVVVKKADAKPEPKTQEVRDLRTTLRQKISKGELTFGQNEARVLGIMDAISRDLETGLRSQGKDAAARLAKVGGPPDARALAHGHRREIAPSLLRARAAAGRHTAAPEKPRIPGLPEGFTPRRYVLPGGWEVWVGRSAKQNDELTHRR